MVLQQRPGRDGPGAFFDGRGWGEWEEWKFWEGWEQWEFWEVAADVFDVIDVIDVSDVAYKFYKSYVRGRLGWCVGWNGKYDLTLQTGGKPGMFLLKYLRL